MGVECLGSGYDSGVQVDLGQVDDDDAGPPPHYAPRVQLEMT